MGRNFSLHRGKEMPFTERVEEKREKKGTGRERRRGFRDLGVLEVLNRIHGESLEFDISHH